MTDLAVLLEDPAMAKHAGLFLLRAKSLAQFNGVDVEAERKSISGVVDLEAGKVNRGGRAPLGPGENGADPSA